jgi:hypothetical protein
MKRRDIALTLILVVELGYVAWGAGAAASPDHLLGPGGKGILPAGYEGYSRGSWSQLVGTTPFAADFMRVLYRMYGIYNVLFGLMSGVVAVSAFRRGERWAWWALLVGNTIALVSAIAYDRTVNAIGPFERSEYLGLAMVWVALAITVPHRATAASDDGRSRAVAARRGA